MLHPYQCWVEKDSIDVSFWSKFGIYFQRSDEVQLPGGEQDALFLLDMGRFEQSNNKGP